MEQKIIGVILVFVTLFAPLPEKKSQFSDQENLTLQEHPKHKSPKNDGSELVTQEYN